MMAITAREMNLSGAQKLSWKYSINASTHREATHQFLGHQKGLWKCKKMHILTSESEQSRRMKGLWARCRILRRMSWTSHKQMSSQLATKTKMMLQSPPLLVEFQSDRFSIRILEHGHKHQATLRQNKPISCKERLKTSTRMTASTQSIFSMMQTRARRAHPSPYLECSWSGNQSLQSAMESPKLSQKLQWPKNFLNSSKVATRVSSRAQIVALSRTHCSQDPQ